MGSINTTCTPLGNKIINEEENEKKIDDIKNIIILGSKNGSQMVLNMIREVDLDNGISSGTTVDYIAKEFKCVIEGKEYIVKKVYESIKFIEKDKNIQGTFGNTALLIVVCENENKTDFVNLDKLKLAHETIFKYVEKILIISINKEIKLYDESSTIIEKFQKFFFENYSKKCHYQPISKDMNSYTTMKNLITLILE